MSLDPFNRLPHEPEAEAALLGSLILCGSHARREPIMASLRRDAFFLTPHRLMFDALGSMHARGASIDSITLLDSLRSSGTLDDAGGPAAIGEILSHVPFFEHLEDYAEAVRRAWRLRFIASECDRAAATAAANENVDPIQLAGDLASRLHRMLARNASNAPAADPTADLDDRISAAERGDLRALPMPWPKLNTATRMLLPGSTTMLCAEPGVGKSRCVLQLMEDLQSHGIRCAALMLEGSRGEHLARALVMVERDVRFADPDFMKREAAKVRDAKARHIDALEKLGHAIWDQPAAPMSLADVTAWAHGRALEGARVLFIDPITAALAGKDRFIEDAQTIRALGEIAERFKCSIVLTTHPRGGAGSKPSLENMACGLCYPRSAWNALWLRRLKPPRTAVVESYYGVPETVDVTAEMIVMKARHSWGADCSFAFDDERAKSLNFTERGLVTEWEPDEQSRANVERATHFVRGGSVEDYLRETREPDGPAGTASPPRP